MIGLLIWLLVLLVVLYVVKLILDMIPLSPQIKSVAWIIVGLIFLIALIRQLGVL